MSQPLDFGELQNLCDQDVTADFEGNFGFNAPDGFVAIVDAECELVCYAPQGKAKLLERMINVYEPPILE